MTSEEKAREFMLTLLQPDDGRLEQKVAELAAMLPSDPAPALLRMKAVAKRVAKPITKLKIARGPRLPIKKKK